MSNKYQYHIRVYYADTDAAGVVYHATYLKYMDQARIEVLRGFDLSLQRLKQEFKLCFVVRGLKIQYLRPARLDDKLCVESNIVQKNKASLMFIQKIYQVDKVQCLCQGEIKLVAVSSSFKLCKLPHTLIQNLVMTTNIN